MPIGPNVNIGYTLINLDEVNRSAVQDKIEEALDEYFYGGYVEVINSNDDEITELVYSIETPVFNSIDQKVKFFIELEQLFNKTDEYKPYFCNYKEED